MKFCPYSVFNSTFRGRIVFLEEGKSSEEALEFKAPFFKPKTEGICALCGCKGPIQLLSYQKLSSSSFSLLHFFPRKTFWVCKHCFNAHAWKKTVGKRFSSSQRPRPLNNFFLFSSYGFLCAVDISSRKSAKYNFFVSGIFEEEISEIKKSFIERVENFQSLLIELIQIIFPSETPLAIAFQTDISNAMFCLVPTFNEVGKPYLGVTGKIPEVSIIK